MKKFVLALTLINSSIISLAQTYLSPLFNFDLAKIENNYEGIPNEHITILENGYAIESVSLGIKVRQNISKSVFVTLLMNYGSKEIKADKNNIFDIEGIKYNYFHNHFSINYSFPSMYIGTGVSYNFLENIEYSYQKRGNKYQRSDKGLIITLGRTFSNFDLELYYYKGLSTINVKNMDLYLKPINSFGIYLAYNIKLFEDAGHQPSCPKF